MERRYGFPVKREWVRFSTGCVTGISWMIHAFTQPGDSCMILTPVYYPFHNVVTNNDRKLVKLFLMCSPHNPAGRVWTEEELDKVLAICKRHGVLVVSDEIHQDIVFGENRFVPAAVVSGGRYRDIVVTLNSASKTFNLATLIHSHIIITDEGLRETYDRFASGLNRTEISIMGMTAAMAGYEKGGEWLGHVLDVIGDNYDYLKETLEEKLPGVRVCGLEGTYLPMIDLRTYVEPDKVQDFVQKGCRLAVDYGEWFGDRYKGFIRMNLATDPAYVRQAVERIVGEIRM